MPIKRLSMQVHNPLHTALTTAPIQAPYAPTQPTLPLPLSSHSSPRYSIAKDTRKKQKKVKCSLSPRRATRNLQRSCPVRPSTSPYINRSRTTQSRTHPRTPVKEKKPQVVWYGMVLLYDPTKASNQARYVYPPQRRSANKCRKPTKRDRGTVHLFGLCSANRSIPSPPFLHVEDFVMRAMPMVSR